MHNTDGAQAFMLVKKEASLTQDAYYNSIYETLWKRSNYRDGVQINVPERG